MSFRAAWQLLSTLALLFLACFVTAAAQAQSAMTLSGRLSVTYFDSFDRRDRLTTELKVQRSRLFKLVLRGRSRAFRDGDRVMLRGSPLRANALRVNTMRGIRQHYPTARAAASGTNKVAVIRISGQDGGPICSAAQIIDRVWSGAKSIRGMYEASSYGALSFEADGDGDGAPDLFEVSLPYNTVGMCASRTVLQADADNLLGARGINLNAYDHLVYILPAIAGFSGVDAGGNFYGSIPECYWAGIATLGGRLSWIRGEWCGDTENAVDVIAHEMGHNLGFMHARQDADFDRNVDADGEYGDLSCLMGGANRSWRHFNALHTFQAGWIDTAPDIQYPGGEFDLTALEEPVATPDAPHILRFRTTAGDVFLSYREPTGPYTSSWQDPYINRVSVHHGTAEPSYTNFVRALSDGQSLTDPISGATVTQMSHGGGRAKVRVDLPCDLREPLVNITPGRITANSVPATAVYEITIQSQDQGNCASAPVSTSMTLPYGILVRFSSHSVVLPAGGAATFTATLTAQDIVPPGEYVLPVRVHVLGHSVVDTNFIFSYELPTPTPSVTPTRSRTPTPMRTATATLTATSTRTPTRTPASSATPVFTPASSVTPTPTPSQTGSKRALGQTSYSDVDGDGIEDRLSARSSASNLTYLTENSEKQSAKMIRRVNAVPAAGRYGTQGEFELGAVSLKTDDQLEWLVGRAEQDAQVVIFGAHKDGILTDCDFDGDGISELAVLEKRGASFHLKYRSMKSGGLSSLNLKLGQVIDAACADTDGDRIDEIFVLGTKRGATLPLMEHFNALKKLVRKAAVRGAKALTVLRADSAVHKNSVAILAKQGGKYLLSTAALPGAIEIPMESIGGINPEDLKSQTPRTLSTLRRVERSGLYWPSRR